MTDDWIDALIVLWFSFPQWFKERIMQKSRRQNKQIAKGRDKMLSDRFEAKMKRSKARRKVEKAGRRASRGR